MKRYILVYVLSLALISCSDNATKDSHDLNKDHEGHNHEILASAESPEDNHGAELQLCPEEAKAAGITTAIAEKEMFSDVIPAIGEVLPLQGDMFTVTAKNDGFVLFGAKKIVSGAHIISGERLLVITTEGATQNSYAESVFQAEIIFNTTKEQYERNKALISQKLVTVTELQQSLAAYENAKLRLETLMQNFEKDGLKIISPISGYVMDVLVSEGQYVQVGQTLFTASKNNNVMLRAEVSSQYITQLSKVVSANFRTSASGEFLSVKSLGGKVASYGRSVSSNSLLVPVYFSIPYRSEIASGSYAEIKLLLSEGNNNVVLPNSAIIEELSSYFVFTKDEHGYEKREVTIGGSDGLRVEILSGILPGDEVVVSGAPRLKLIERLSSSDGAAAAHAGHSH